MPSENDDVVTSPYNSFLSLSKLTETCDCVVPVDNQSLFNIYERIYQVPSNSRKAASSLTDNDMSLSKIYSQKSTRKMEAFDTMNNIVANFMLNMTSSMRFEGTMNVDINDIVTNLVPFSKLNFLASSMAPFCAFKDVKSSSKL